MDIEIIKQYKELKEFDKNELKNGIKIEMEHISDSKKYSQKEKIEIATYIAKAHLSEFADYYTRLDFIEKTKFQYFKISKTKYKKHFKELYLYCMELSKNKWLFLKEEDNKNINKLIPVYKLDFSGIDYAKNLIEQFERKPRIQILFVTNIKAFEIHDKLLKMLFIN